MKSRKSSQLFAGFSSLSFSANLAKEVDSKCLSVQGVALTLKGRLLFLTTIWKLQQMLDEFLGNKECHPAKACLENDIITTAEEWTACQNISMGLSQAAVSIDSAGNDVTREVGVNAVF